jgi:hypothetical protein
VGQCSDGLGLRANRAALEVGQAYPMNASALGQFCLRQGGQFAGAPQTG